MIISSNKITIIAIVICATIVFSVTKTLDKYKLASVRPVNIEEIVIDPGHGGFDGGAEGKHGTIEKDLNLSISLKLRDILILNGFKVVMIREDDTAINDNEAKDKVSKKKVSDMHNRLDIMNKNPYSLTLSIHQNMFKEEKYSGAQVFYSPNNPLSKNLADSIQSNFAVNLQKDNDREIKPAEKNLFLMYKSKNPAVLVECGFISNSAESLLLKDEEYQSKVAFVIYLGLVNFLQEVKI